LESGQLMSGHSYIGAWRLLNVLLSNTNKILDRGCERCMDYLEG
jgi:hypothetical protein